MTGQSNADRYEFFALSGLDLITDFDVSEDVIALDSDSTGIFDFATLQFQIQDNGNGNAEIEISAGTDCDYAYGRYNGATVIGKLRFLLKKYILYM